MSGDVGVVKMDMGHLGDFDETHRTGSTQDGLHADAAIRKKHRYTDIH